jgi:hypothetical protein
VLEHAGAARGQGLTAQGGDGAAVLGVDGDHAAAPLRHREDVEDDVVVDLERLGVGHVELERGDAPLDALRHDALRHRLGEGHVHGHVDRRRLGPALPVLQPLDRVAATLRGDVLDDGRGAPDGGGDGAGVEVVARPDGTEREVEVGVGVDAPGDDEAARGVDHLLAGQGREAGCDLCDAAVGAGAHVGDPFAVDIDEGPARYEHVNNSSAEVDSLLKAVVSRTS